MIQYQILLIVGIKIRENSVVSIVPVHVLLCRSKNQLLVVSIPRRGRGARY